MYKAIVHMMLSLNSYTLKNKNQTKPKNSPTYISYLKVQKLVLN